MRLVFPVQNDGDDPAPRDRIPSEWWEASGWGRHTARSYIAARGSYHTGADFNRHDRLERGKPVYAVADGVVVAAREFRGWLGGAVVVVWHEHLDLCSRYAHVEALVHEGDTVHAGQVIAVIADYPPSGRIGDHLHFDLARGDFLVRNPAHWCGAKLRCVETRYLDPMVALFADLAVR